MVCTGYIGCEAFDLILYICRTLTKLKYRVLIIDFSDSAALLQSIKLGMGLDSLKEIINYRDINYTRRIPDKEELELFKDGAVFINYGNTYQHEYQLECESINIVVSIFPHMIQEINKYLKTKISQNETYKVLIRDMITPDDADRVLEALELPEKADKISTLYLDMNDYESAVNCQISQTARFTKISKQTKQYITGQILDMFPKLTKNRVKRAMTLARKGV
jgi:hypothetical protein